MDDAYSMESVVFIYNAVPKDAEKPVLYADGKPVESLEAVSMLTAELKYLTVGRTGVVFRAPGMDRAVRCELDEAGIPAGDADAAVGKYGYYYFPLSELPTFRFSPEGLGRMEISSLVIGIGEWYANEARCYLLNAVSGEWEETAVNRPVENPENYADANGNLYCQFRPMAGETYTDIPAPTLTLEGRVKDDQP